MINLEGLLGLTIALAIPFTLVGIVALFLRLCGLIGPKRKRYYH